MRMPMKTLKRAVIGLGALILAACGGGGGDSGAASFSPSPTTPTTPTTPVVAPAPVAASLELIASALEVPTGGDEVTITATVKDAGNVTVGAAPIRFVTDSGNLAPQALTTNKSGVATAILTAGSNRSNRTIVVTATSGTAVGSITLPVVGTTLSYSGVTTVALGGTVQATATAKDSKGTAISNLPIVVTSSLNNALSAASLRTVAQGSATASYTATNAGTDALTFAGGGATVSTSIAISAENFAFSSPTADTTIPVDTKQPVTVQYLRNGVVQVGKTVAFAATAGTLTAADTTASDPCTSVATVITATTNSAGQATLCVASMTASPASIQATLTGVAGVSAQASLPVLFVAVTPAKVVLQVTPAAISPNAAGSTAQKATVLATVTDARGNPVSGVTVNFNRTADPSGGNLSQASALTTSSGQASVQYIAGATTTANNGVQIQAVAQGFSAVSAGVASLTVSQSALFIALGTGNTILSIDAQTYQKDWVVYVTDSNGVAVSNVGVTIKVLPLQYRKGALTFGSTGWDTTSSNPLCANEDANYNGVLDPANGSVPAEDSNGDGILEPGNVISVTTSSTSGASSGIVTTGSTGRATISLVYAKSYTRWVQVKLVASAVVTGTESATQAIFWTPGSGADYGNVAVAPPGEISPFGENSCQLPN